DHRLHPLRPGAGARRQWRGADRGAAGRAADRPDRAGLHGRHLARHRRAQRHAGRARREAQRDHQRRVERSGAEAEIHRSRRRAGAAEHGRVAHIHRRRSRQVGQGHPMRRYQSGVGSTMKLRRRDFLQAAAGTAALPLLSHAARAQAFPSRVITIVVPYPAGGPTDTIARILADRMGTVLHQTVIAENISGAGGSIGVGRVARATPDGYTLSIGHVQTHVLNAAVMKLPYDVVNDFAPISLIADTPIWIISKTAVPATDFKSFLAWLKEENGKATAGTVGIGGPTEIAGLIFAKQTGTQFQTARYTGGAPLLQDLLGGHIDFAFGQAATYLSYVRNGQLKAYAVLQPKRWWAAPEVPTLDELGIPNI